MQNLAAPLRILERFMESRSTIRKTQAPPGSWEDALESWGAFPKAGTFRSVLERSSESWTASKRFRAVHRIFRRGHRIFGRHTEFKGASQNLAALPRVFQRLRGF